MRQPPDTAVCAAPPPPPRLRHPAPPPHPHHHMVCTPHTHMHMCAAVCPTPDPQTCVARRVGQPGERARPPAPVCGRVCGRAAAGLHALLQADPGAQQGQHCGCGRGREGEGGRGRARERRRERRMAHHHTLLRCCQGRLHTMSHQLLASGLCLMALHAPCSCGAPFSSPPSRTHTASCPTHSRAARVCALIQPAQPGALRAWQGPHGVPACLPACARAAVACASAHSL